MVIDIPCTNLLNEQKLWTEKDPIASTEFRREVVNRGIQLDNLSGKVVVDFHAKTGYLRVHSYPPAMYTKTMRTCALHFMNTEEFKKAMRLRQQRKQKGGAVLKYFDEKLGCMVKRDLASGIITPA